MRELLRLLTDYSKVKQLNKLVASKMGFKDYFAVSGQTYPRSSIDDTKFLSSVAESAYKFSNDIRLLQNMKEIEEPFEKPDRLVGYGV